ncbi:hypothetical protein E2C01_092756 [Portunus trituberculatus]|uniref:Uncharacterized protein n=1 Tax=Portunus trituberculatus TaxID=210409 RepID=A0A5B7JL27_PORTR|nr:hypothetical protein [Portunus trituberculatus]
MSESATVHAYLATLLAKLYPTPDTTCYKPPPTQYSRSTHTHNHWARQGNQGPYFSFQRRNRKSLTLSGRDQDSIQDRGGTGIS